MPVQRSEKPYCVMGGPPTGDRSRLCSKLERRSIGGGWNNRVHSRGTQLVQGRGVLRSDNGDGDR